jgi:hypothetical protein
LGRGCTKAGYAFERRRSQRIFYGWQANLILVGATDKPRIRSWNSAPSEGDRFDIIDPSGDKWEVRSITPATGVYFCPSNMVGSSRHFSEPGFLEKLDETAGFLLTDIESFPNVPFWRVTSQQVRHWWETHMLGAATRVSRTRALELLRRL